VQAQHAPWAACVRHPTRHPLTSVTNPHHLVMARGFAAAARARRRGWLALAVLCQLPPRLRCAVPAGVGARPSPPCAVCLRVRGGEDSSLFDVGSGAPEDASDARAGLREPTSAAGAPPVSMLCARATRAPREAGLALSSFERAASVTALCCCSVQRGMNLWKTLSLPVQRLSLARSIDPLRTHSFPLRCLLPGLMARASSFLSLLTARLHGIDGRPRLWTRVVE
jgi:hypothetical protein